MKILFASMFGDDPLPAVTPLSKNAIHGWIVIGSVLFVVTVLFIWAAFIRKRRRRKHRHHHHRRSMAKAAAEGMGEIRRQVHERQRRRRSEQRRRNPTLAETGGLPPARTDVSPSQPPS